MSMSLVLQPRLVAVRIVLTFQTLLCVALHIHDSSHPEDVYDQNLAEFESVLRQHLRPDQILCLAWTETAGWAQLSLTTRLEPWVRPPSERETVDDTNLLMC